MPVISLLIRVSFMSQSAGFCDYFGKKTPYRPRKFVGEPDFQNKAKKILFISSLFTAVFKHLATLDDKRPACVFDNTDRAHFT